MAAADGLHLDRLHHDGGLGGGKAEAGPVELLKGRSHLLAVACGHFERGVGSLIAQEEADLDVEVGVGRVGSHLGVGRGRQFADITGDRRRQLLGEGSADGPLGYRAHVGQADAQRREHAGMGMDQHGGHAQLVGYPAGVLAPGPAEAGQGVGAHVVAPLHRDGLDGVGHVLDRHIQEPISGPLGGPWLSGGVGDGRSQIGESGPGRSGVERLVAVGAEHRREVAGVQPA